MGISDRPATTVGADKPFKLRSVYLLILAGKVAGLALTPSRVGR